MEQDAIFVNQVKVTYEWAYSVFTKDLEVTHANNDRWIDTARHLLRAQSIAERVETEVYQLIIAEQKEYWGRKFEESLKILAQGSYEVSPDYFGFYMQDSDFPGQLKRESRVNETSVKVVVEFSRGKSQGTDPIALAEKNGEFKNWNKGPVGRGLKQHIFMMEKNRKHREMLDRESQR